MKTAYLHFGGPATVDGPDSARVTLRVPVKETELPLAALRNVTGYGPRIPTRYMVQHAGRWRRVYVANYGNAGTAYIGKPGAWLATVNLA